MGFYVGSASKYLSCVCLNSKECFKRKELSGDLELACLHLNGKEKNNTVWIQKASVCNSQKSMVCDFNTLILCSSVPA